MIFSYNWLQEYSVKKLPAPKKLAELLSLHAFEVEEVKKVKGDWLFTIDVLPNRAHDCLCHTGIAREIAAICKGKLVLPKTRTIRSRKGNLAPLKVRVQNSQLVPRYAALVVEEVKVKPSPEWLRQRLESVGVNSINNIVDLTNFVMLETSQPMHAFDYDNIQGHAINIRQAQEGERLQVLDGKTFSLPKGALVIEDKNRLIDLAGIKGGEVSGIKSQTRNIVLQAANFDSTAIYRTKQHLAYSTQAANIYSHRISSELAMPALERAYALLQKLGVGGEVVQVLTMYPNKERPARIALDMKRVESLLGMPISRSEAARILRSLDCAVAYTGNRLTVVPPARRLDLAIPEDLIEELGRMHGYQAIPALLPVAPLTSPAIYSNAVWEERIRDACKGAGFTEVYNYSFVGKKNIEAFGYSKTSVASLVALENPISEDFSYLRSSLLENLLKNVKRNQNHSSAVRLFEIGNVFRASKGKVEETSMLGAVALGANFYEMKGVGDVLLRALGIPAVWYDDYNPTPEHSVPALWEPGKCAELKVDPPAGGEIGFVGEISQRVRQTLKISKPVASLHINLGTLSRLATEERSYLPPPKFPSLFRDIAVLVPYRTKVAQVMNAMHDAGGKLVQDIDLFDMYAGEEIAEGKKNLAFHIVYQAEDRTLTNKEVDALHDTIIKTLEQNPEWEVRK